MVKKKVKKKRYPVFLQALALTIVAVIIGMYIGIQMENARVAEVTGYQIDSEVALIDILTLNSMIDSDKVDCEDLVQTNFDLLDRVYEDAIILDDYEKSGKLTQTIKSLHKKYDVLRAYLWIDAVKIKNKCSLEIDTIVYLYNSSTEDLTKKAEQNVWSKILYDVKAEMPDNLLLIPIAADTDLRSLEAMIEGYGIESLPVVIVNEEIVIRELVSSEDIIGLF